MDDNPCWQLTVALVEGCEPGQDPRLRAMAYLGAAVILFERCDPELAGVILLAIDERLAKRF